MYVYVYIYIDFNKDKECNKNFDKILNVFTLLMWIKLQITKAFLLIHEFVFSSRSRVFIEEEFNTSLETIALPNDMYALNGNKTIDYVLFFSQLVVIIRCLFEIFECRDILNDFHYFSKSFVRYSASQNVSLTSLINAYDIP